MSCGDERAVELRDRQEEVAALAAPRSRCSIAGSMLIALWRASSLLRAGQTSTQTPQPVQSSGATWIVSRWPGRSSRPERLATGSRPARRRASSGVEHLHADRGVRADDRALAAVDADRRGPRSGSPARSRRFSKRAVPVGNVPSTGSALTGSRSPSPAMHACRHALDEVGRVVGDGGAAERRLVDRRPGRRRGASAGQRARRRPRGCARRRSGRACRRCARSASLIARDAPPAAGSTPARAEEARLHHGVDAAAPSRASRATRAASITHSSSSLSTICSLDLARQVVPDLVGVRTGCSSRNVAPASRAARARPCRSRQAELVAGDEVGPLDQVGRADRAAGRSAGARR